MRCHRRAARPASSTRDSRQACGDGGARGARDVQRYAAEQVGGGVLGEPRQATEQGEGGELARAAGALGQEEPEIGGQEQGDAHGGGEPAARVGGQPQQNRAGDEDREVVAKGGGTQAQAGGEGGSCVSRGGGGIKQYTPPPLEGGGWGEGLVPGPLRNDVPRRPLPPTPTPSLKGRGRSLPTRPILPILPILPTLPTMPISPQRQPDPGQCQRLSEREIPGDRAGVGEPVAPGRQQDRTRRRDAGEPRDRAYQRQRQDTVQYR